MKKPPPPRASIQDAEHASLGRTGDARDRIADDRDERAQAADVASDARDERAHARDGRAEARERTAYRIDEGAAADRAGALRDRREGASDRVNAAENREAAAADRVLAAEERVVSSIDELTGAYRRDAGTLELQREFARSKRTDRTFILTFVDVDGLKATNDSLGHAAGDRRLRQTVDSMRTHLRSYDLIVRFGGDEFVCALVDLDMSAATDRFESIAADLAETGHGSITVGLAELRADESLERLIARADEALYERRGKEAPAVPS